MKKAILGALCAFLSATLACSIFVGGPSYPPETGSAPTETGLSLEETIRQAVASASESGVVSFELTQGQLTSYLVAASAKQNPPALVDPRVYLQDGHMIVYGRVRSGIFTANVSITMQATVDASGQPQIEIEKTDFGPFAAPQGLNEAVTAFVREAFTGWLGPVATGFRLEHITIGNGVMTVTGRIK